MLTCDVEILEQEDNLTLAQYWSELNHYDWPAKIPNPEPKKHEANSRRGEIMGWIMNKIGLKECLRDWNKERMPGEQFDLWWNTGLKQRSCV